MNKIWESSKDEVLKIEAGVWTINDFAKKLVKTAQERNSDIIGIFNDKEIRVSTSDSVAKIISEHGLGLAEDRKNKKLSIQWNIDELDTLDFWNLEKVIDWIYSTTETLRGGVNLTDNDRYIIVSKFIKNNFYVILEEEPNKESIEEYANLIISSFLNRVNNTAEDYLAFRKAINEWREKFWKK